jgi:hypothetical protein
MNKAEQWIVSSLLVIALLTFFFPLTTIRVPVLGNMDLSGYDLISKAQVLNHDLDAIGDQRLADMANGPSEAAPIASAPTPQIAMPFSVRKLLFVPIEILVSFICALIALLTCLRPVKLALRNALLAFGCAAATIAIIHLAIANSDIHTWFQNQITSDPSVDASPLSGLAVQIVQLAANAVQLQASAGLYVLAATMLLATVVLQSGIVSSPSSPSLSVEPIVDQTDHSGRNRVVVFIALAVVTLAAMAGVLMHTRSSEESENGGTPVQVGNASGEFDPTLALGVLYGSVDESSHMATWAHPTAPPKLFSQFAGGPLVVRIVSTLSTTQDGKPTKYLISAARPANLEDYSCHACWDAIGVAEFLYDGSQWRLEASNPYAGPGPGYDGSPAVKLTKIGTEHYAVSWTIKDGGQGEEDSTIYIVAAIGHWIGGVFKQDLSSSYDDGECSAGSSRCYSNSTSIQFVTGNNRDYYDIKTSTVGSKPNEDFSSVSPVKDTRTYSLIDHIYR